jgi:hypothetical protein
MTTEMLMVRCELIMNLIQMKLMKVSDNLQEMILAGVQQPMVFQLIEVIMRKKYKTST